MEYKSHILVVDDEPQVRDLVATVLRHEGYLVETAEAGRQALIMLADNSFDLIVTDLMMSEVSGLDVLAEVKVRWPATEVILITAHATLGSAVDALRHGAYDYLSKPFSSHDLLLSIRRASAYHQLKLEKENLLTRLQQRVRTRNALVKAAQQIATVLDQREVIHTILEAAFDVLPEVELAAVCYKSAESQLIIRGMNNERVEVATLPFDEDLISRVLGQRQTVYYPTWATPTLARENSIEVRKESLIIEPLIQAGSALGALVIISQKPDAFDEDLRQLLTMLATQAAIAMQNAQLYTEARRVDELEALYEAGRIINRTLDLQETLSATLAITRSLTGATVGHVYFYAPEHQRLTSVITSGDELTLTDADRRQSADIALRLLADYHTDNSTVGQKVTIIRTPSADAAGDEVEKYGIQSWLAVPLIRDGDLAVSVLELGSEKVDAFTADDVRLVQVIIGQATTAIENSRLYEEVRLRLRQTEALGTISQSISNTLDLRRVFDLVVHAATKTIPVTTHSWLYLLDEESACFVLEAQAVKQSVLASTGLEAYRRQVIQQAAQLQSPVRQVWLDDEQTPWSLLVAPLKVNEKVIGAISVESPRSDAFLSGDEILLNAFANHASIAIQNANLFRELSSAYRDLAYHQAEILRSHKTLQALFDGITDGLYIVDQDMRIIAINEAEASRWDKSPEALVGQPCDATLWGEAAPTMAKLVMETFETGHEGNWESQVASSHRGPFIDRDVRTYPIFLSAVSNFSSPSKEAEKRSVGQVIILAQDVSEKRQLQASLFRSANLAVVGRLASSIAHQINNPLTVIIANGQLLELEMDPESPDYPVIQDIVESGTQIRQIVQNLLDFSAQESYDWFETDIQRTIEDGLALVSHPLRKSNIEVIKQIDDFDPIIASANHLKLVWMNLLLNARDAIIERGQAGVIKIYVRQTVAGDIQVQIVDNGIGILPEYQDHLFRPFFSTKPPEQGLGLGLYTCRTIVDYHQGKIELKNNRDGFGLTVTVTLPPSLRL